jgi:hypothetical protein
MQLPNFARERPASPGRRCFETKGRERLADNDAYSLFAVLGDLVVWPRRCNRAALMPQIRLGSAACT